ncbi:hypothetical protein H0H92_011443, partial [Tricholoma furcatifolium]
MALGHMSLPLQLGESAEDFQQRRAALNRQQRVASGDWKAHPQSIADAGSSVTGPEAASTPAPTGGIKIPLWRDRVTLQKIRMTDLESSGTTRIKDQGVVFYQGQPYDTTASRIVEVKREASASRTNIRLQDNRVTGDPSQVGKEEADEGGREPPRRDSPPHRPYGGPPPPEGPPSGGGSPGPGNGPPRQPSSEGSGRGPPPPDDYYTNHRGGGPPGPPDDPGNDGNGVEEDDPRRPVPRRGTRGFSMPRATHRPRYATPGVEEAHEYHRQTMHGRLLDIIEELLSRRVQPPEGIKSKRMDPAKTITAYTGSPKFGDLEDWLMS